MANQIPIIALCGFLGSGKTTLLRRWRRDKALDDAAFIVHDLSDLGIDAELLTKEEDLLEMGKLNGRVAALHGIHAKQYLNDSLKNSFDEISKLKPEAPMVLSESTGAARPWPLIKALTQDNRFYLRHFIVTVDALNLHRDFEDGMALTGEVKAPKDEALSRAAHILAEQLAFASIIILTKIDTIKQEYIESQVRNLQKIQPNITIGLSAQAGLLLPQLENVIAPDITILEDIAKKIGLSAKASIVDEVDVSIFSSSKPFHPERLHYACQNNLGTGLYRTKGFLWLASRPGDALLWQQSGSHISLELKGKWRAEVAKNAEGRLLPEEEEGLKKQLKNEHPLFGDRCNELTLIGLKKDREGFLSALEKAICTDEEINEWVKGKAFSDPWPTRLLPLELD